MKLSHSILTLALAFLFCGCIHIETGKSRSDSSGDYDVATELVSEGGIGAEIRELEVVNRNGKLRIVGSESGPWTWKHTLQLKDRDAEAGATAARSVSIAATTNGQVLRVELETPDNLRHTRVRSDLEMRVPRNTAVRVTQGFGPVEIEGISSNVTAKVSNGKLTLEDIGGTVTAESSFGAMAARRTGPARLTNRNGSIDALEIRGSLDAKTGFASLRAESIGGPARLKNANGPIEVSGATELDASTSFGSLEARNIAGAANLENRNGRIVASELHGPVIADTSFAPLTLDTDGPSITGRNQNGSIHIRSRSVSLTNLVAETSFATLEVRLPSGLNPRIEAHSDFGKVESDFQVITHSPSGSGASAGEPRIQLNDRNGTIRVIRD